jgi:hypothetical protein
MEGETTTEDGNKRALEVTSTGRASKRVRWADDYRADEDEEEEEEDVGESDVKFLEDVWDMMDHNTFSKLFFAGRKSDYDGDVAIRQLADSAAARAAFKSCLGVGRIEMPEGGLPSNLTQLEVEFVEAVLESMSGGAADAAEAHLEKDPPGMPKQDWWPIVMERYFDYCCEDVRHPVFNSK